MKIVQTKWPCVFIVLNLLCIHVRETYRSGSLYSLERLNVYDWIIAMWMVTRRHLLAERLWLNYCNVNGYKKTFISWTFMTELLQCEWLQEDIYQLNVYDWIIEMWMVARRHLSAERLWLNYCNVYGYKKTFISWTFMTELLQCVWFTYKKTFISWTFMTELLQCEWLQEDIYQLNVWSPISVLWSWAQVTPNREIKLFI
jgi:hypothetical protein